MQLPRMDVPSLVWVNPALVREIDLTCSRLPFNCLSESPEVAQWLHDGQGDTRLIECRVIVYLTVFRPLLPKLSALFAKLLSHKAASFNRFLVNRPGPLAR